MRKTKRFTPNLLDRYEKIGRGTGTYKNYQPWHQVTRGDPSSIGLSSKPMWKGRQRDFLSGDEWVCFFFSTMLQNIEDVREQFPLQIEEGSHELNAYNIRHGGYFPGTREIASTLGIKHPRINGNGRSTLWKMTTDLLLTLRRPDGSYYLLAIACKPINFKERKRTKEKLEIERAYWMARDTEWLLITPNEYRREVALTLKNSFAWALDIPVKNEELRNVVENIQNFNGFPLTSCLCAFAEFFDDMNLAQRSIWQCAWSGRVCMDLLRGWRPHLPIRLISAKEFWQLNPIASRRSSWI